MLNWASIGYSSTDNVHQLLEDSRLADPSYEYQDRESILVLERSVNDLELTKDDLVGLARSLDWRMLKKIVTMLRSTKVCPPLIRKLYLTSLQTVNHVATSDVRNINLSSTMPEAVFRTIPHLAFKGFLYSSRTAAILAILTLIAKVPHLSPSARSFLQTLRGTWLSVTTPQNFSFEFLRFIASLPHDIKLVTLSDEENNAFERMAKYQILEELMDRKVLAVVPWTPMKTKGLGDRKRTCTGCQEMRSETMMVQIGGYRGRKEGDKYRGVEIQEEDGMRCGMCVDSPKNPGNYPGVSEVESCWVECQERWCRAIYVVEDYEGLKVRTLSILSFSLPQLLRMALSAVISDPSSMLLLPERPTLPLHFMHDVRESNNYPSLLSSSQIRLQIFLCMPSLQERGIHRPSTYGSDVDYFEVYTIRQ